MPGTSLDQRAPFQETRTRLPAARPAASLVLLELPSRLELQVVRPCSQTRLELRQTFEIHFTGRQHQAFFHVLGELAQIPILKERQCLQSDLRIEGSSVQLLRGGQRGRQVDATQPQ